MDLMVGEGFVFFDSLFEQLRTKIAFISFISLSLHHIKKTSDL